MFSEFWVILSISNETPRIPLGLFGRSVWLCVAKMRDGDIQSQSMGKSTRGGGTFIGFPRMESGDNPSRQTIPNVSSS